MSEAADSLFRAAESCIDMGGHVQIVTAAGSFDATQIRREDELPGIVFCASAGSVECAIKEDSIIAMRLFDEDAVRGLVSVF